MPDNANRRPPLDSSRFYAWVFRRRWAIWSASILVAVLCLLSARGVVWREDVMDLLPDSDPVVAEYREWMARFRPLDRVFIMVGPADGVDGVSEDELIAAADLLYEGLMEGVEEARARGAANPDVDAGKAPTFAEARSGKAPVMTPAQLIEDATYRLDAGQVLELTELLRERRAVYSSVEQGRRLEDLLRPEATREALEGWKKVLTEYPAPMMARMFRRDPLGLDVGLLRSLEGFQNLGEDLVRHRDRLFSTDKTRILIIAHPRHPSTDSYHAAALIALIDRLKAETVRASAGRVRVADLAGHRFSLENASRVKRDILKTVGISTIGVVVLTALSFANPLFVPLALLPAAFGACFALGLIRWLSPNVSAISVGCGSMLIGIAVDYGIHILYHSDHAGTGRGKAGGTRKTGAARLLEILPRLTRPLLLSAGTTVLAFLALRFSILPGYRDLGLFAALGIGGAAVFALTALPPLVPILKSVLPGRGRPILPLGYWFLLFMRRTRQKRLAPTLILAALTLVALAGWPRLRIEGDYQKMNALEPETRRDWDRILEFFGGGLRVSPIAVRGASLEEALEENERLYQALVKLKEEGVVAEFQSIAPILPSQRSQGQNAARWAAFWSTERIEALRDALAKAGEGMGMRPEAFQPFFDSLPGSLERVGPEDLKQAGLARLIETHLSVGEENTLVLTHARTDDPAAFARLVERLRPDFPGLLAANGQVFMGYMARLIFGELRRMALIAFILVAGLLLVSMRSPRSVLVMLLPLALSAFWTFGFMGWLGVSINLMNSIVTIFIMGLVVDYSIFLYHAWEGHGAASHSGRLASSGAAVAISAMTTLAGFGALALASHPVLHSIGFTALLGISTGWLAVTLAFPLLGKRG